jgi:hypothetical protein
VLACQSRAQRCRDLNLQSFSNRVYEEQQADYWQRVEAAPGYLGGPDSLKKRVESEMRLQMGGDSMLVSRTPPPRPSDLAWSAEHCYQGSAR